MDMAMEKPFKGYVWGTDTFCVLIDSLLSPIVSTPCVYTFLWCFPEWRVSFIPANKSKRKEYGSKQSQKYSWRCGWKGSHFEARAGGIGRKSGKGGKGEGGKAQWKPKKVLLGVCDLGLYARVVLAKNLVCLHKNSEDYLCKRWTLSKLAPGYIRHGRSHVFSHSIPLKISDFGISTVDGCQKNSGREGGGEQLMHEISNPAFSLALIFFSWGEKSIWPIIFDNYFMEVYWPRTLVCNTARSLEMYPLSYCA